MKKKSLYLEGPVDWGVVKEVMKSMEVDETAFCSIDEKFFRIDREK